MTPVYPHPTHLFESQKSGVFHRDIPGKVVAHFYGPDHQQDSLEFVRLVDQVEESKLVTENVMVSLKTVTQLAKARLTEIEELKKRLGEQEDEHAKERDLWVKRMEEVAAESLDQSKPDVMPGYGVDDDNHFTDNPF